MAGCCGARAKLTEYEVTFRDGSKQVFASSMQARVAAAQDTTSDPSGVRKAATVRAVPKAK